MSKKILVKSKEYILSEEQVKIMNFFKETEAIQQSSQDFVMTFELFQPRVFQTILSLNILVNFSYPEFSPVRTDKLSEVIGEKLAKQLERLKFQQLNELFTAAHYLIIDGLKKCLGATLACRFHFPNTVHGFMQKMKELNIKNPYNAATAKVLRERFPFLND